MIQSNPKSLVGNALLQYRFNYSQTERSEFELRREILLEKLASPTGKYKYKRYVNGTSLRYAGGKTLAVGLIVEKLPQNLKRIISPFFGGGSFEIACAKELGLQIIGFDIFDMLVNYWQQQIAHPEELYNHLKRYKPTKAGFLEIKALVKDQWDKQTGRLKPSRSIQNLTELAALFFFNHNTSYGPHFLGWPSSVYLQENRYTKMIEKVKNLKLNNVSVECGDFENVFHEYPNDFFYLDPPYYLDGDSKTFVGLYPHRNFPIHHKNFDHEKLRDLLLKHKGGFILSYNDCSIIRTWYKDFPFDSPTWQYTFSQGDTRIGENRRRDNNGSHIKKSHELLFFKDQDKLSAEFQQSVWNQTGLHQFGDAH